MSLFVRRLVERLLPALLMLSGVAIAQSATEMPASRSDAITQTRKAVVNASDLDDATRTALLKQLDHAGENDAEADATLTSARQGSDPSTLQQRIAELEKTLAADPSRQFERWRQGIDENTPHDELQTELTDLRAASGNLATQITTTTSDLAAADQRPARLAQELDQARRDADSLATASTLPADATLPQRVDALVAQTARRLQLARIAALTAERNALPARSRVLELSQRQLQRQAMLVRRQTDVLESLLAKSSDAEMDALDTRLRVAADDTAGQPEILTREAATNVMLGKELGQAQSAARLASERLRETQGNASDAADSLRNTRARLALHSGDDTVGLILLNERRRIEDPARIREDLAEVRRRLAQAQLRLIDLDEQADALASPEQAAASLMHQADGDDEGATTDGATITALSNLLGTRADLVARLEAAERELLRVLTDLEGALVQQLDTTSELAHLLDRELLWFPSHERVGIVWFKRQLAGWKDLFKPSRYATSGRLLLATAEREWPMVLLVLVLFALLLRNRRHLPERLSALAQPLMRVREDRFRYTLRALTLTTLGAATWPLPVALLGWLLRQAGEAGKFSDSLGHALLAFAGGLFFYRVMRWLVVENGVAQKHFRWTRPRREAISAALPWFIWGVLPAQFLLTLAFVRGQEPAVDAVARLMLLIVCAVSAHALWQLLAPGALWTFRGVAHPEPSRVRQALRVALPAALGAIALLALNGYVLTAATLIHSLWLSLLLVSALAVLHGTISRWFLLGERRLALKRLDARREQAAPEDASTLLPAGSGEPPVPDPENELISIQSVNQQTRSLLRALTATLLVIGLLWVWAGVLPALDRLDAISLWAVSGTDANGKPLLSQITLAAFLGGLLTLALTFVAARNLPGLVEIGLLSRIHIDAGARYAITSISRYLIVILGLIAGLGLMGLRWGQLQWLAAALTVGLGFGLQEIFANFVSGLIVLFERPYRVGDTITIGEVEGTVTRIRTRATTVLDADNREVIVPNKTFITSRFVNWTLSDTITRVVFKLGLAQDADPEKVRALLLDLARADLRVLAQPAPSCWFTQISSGTWDFELRVFVAELGHRNRVRDELNQRIVAAMAQAGLATSRPGTLQVQMLAPSGASATTRPDTGA